jgi:serine-type D-Ala-D-Ala carboxypeptidase/endopeptidase (penicillin-binding protein 4)
MKSGLIFLLLFGLMSLFSCSGSKKIPIIIDVVQDSLPIPKIDVQVTEVIVSKEDILQEILDTSVLNTGFTGIYIYDLEGDSVLYQKHSNHYFIPASNTKILTLFACLKTLGDSIQAFKYVETDGAFTFWGAADPTLLHPSFPESGVLSFLKSKVKNKSIYYSESHSNISAFGRGWMWDDYIDHYQAEITTWPMYANVVTIKKDLSMVTQTPKNVLSKSKDLSNTIKIKRKLDNNEVLFPSILDSIPTYYQQVPYKNASEVNFRLLKNTLGKKIVQKKLPISHQAKIKYSLPVDTVYRRMMQVSDNMLAEHLLLQCGLTIADTISTLFTIDTIRYKYPDVLDSSAVWVDGSGLSRYNLFTPEMMVSVLNDLYKSIPEERLFSLMAIGGGHGSLKNMYNYEDAPYIFAKPGSMAGVYNLSGYLITKSGKKLSFSIMNNNLTCPIVRARKEVSQLIESIRIAY